jgi:hypothetical protein
MKGRQHMTKPEHPVLPASHSKAACSSSAPDDATQAETTGPQVQESNTGDVDATAYHDPLFVLSPARSYSTVTIAMLAGHPQIYGFPELVMFSGSTVEDLLTSKRLGMHLPPVFATTQLNGILRAVADINEGSQSETAIRRAHVWLTSRSTWTTRELIQYLFARVYPRIGVEKSPDTVSSDAALNSCLDAFPGARFIHLTRHPVTAQQSMNRFWRKGLELWGPEKSAAVSEKRLNVATASAWYLSHRRIIAALKTLPDEQWMRVRAEDLIREPYSWLPRIAEWLGLACSDKILARMLQTERWRFANIGPAKRYGGGDPGFMLSPVLRNIDCPPPLDCCASLKLSREMISRIEALARYLGY